MKIIKETLNELEEITSIVQTTINKIYPKYYPSEVVKFFLNHHSVDNIRKALNTETIFLIELDQKLIGTWSIFKNEIKRMFILPEFQGLGYGSRLLDKLEQKAIQEGHYTVELDSSLPAYSLYEKRGYATVKYNKIITSNDQVLCYSEMSKILSNSGFLIDYNNRVFTSISNSDNGEASNKTTFKYKQEKNVIWAEYFGGDIIRGYLVGTCDTEGKLEFCYQHININNQIRTGRCNSKPQILPDGRIKLIEEWEWTNGDKSKGNSIVEEI
ncbi:acetyltransferase, GNAT family [Gottschalkia acidurici 9a]|uniref:Acetyltransferase, GNAT family n=1 Tax=Gottschalkia acidurici (strain ATCC 7906 / DSM 604 / BCRC 14475 / CIP 104303 / KCTC 5404 / NCIMB 10678 / 9a) TaxID=1128398 RepID=K0B288_GOTA9|nr:GNAT family N-acetyltransferase [Gottschalkia acidurici]AFS78756.1 acetyltransferase, GNAT family [Gottschalkia acidurici 9a]